MKAEHVSGVRIETIKLSISETFEDYYPGEGIPRNYKLLIPTGEMRFSNEHVPTFWSGDDFCLAFYPDIDLSKGGPLGIKHWIVISEKGYRILKLFNFKHWLRMSRIIYTRG